ncbi:S41 family peptidase [Polaribacter tangerinus]|uniref:S41 family peptidase n=1 Tax=Polaribacter tangerinus TaxID=1920034 RepID=UPI000B4AA934|nr:S41 family peptidase [Polaribacter tangerinus]
MKNYFNRLFLLLSAICIVQCAKKEPVPNNLVIHDFVWKGLNAYYLHQDKVPKLSDRQFSSDTQLNNYLATFTDYNELYNSLLISEDNKSFLSEEFIDNSLPPHNQFTNGVEFGIIGNPQNDIDVIGYVTHILPGSFAESKDIKRGDFFNAIDGVQLTRNNFEDLLLNGNDNFALSIINFDGLNVSSTIKTVNLEKQNYSYNKAFKEKTITIGADNIGYLIYNNGFSKSDIELLNETFLSFKNSNVNKLILDLRYNISGGSYASDIAVLASIITGQFSNQVLIKEEWNLKAQEWFQTHQPDSLITTFVDKISSTTPINNLEVSDIYIILNGNEFTGSSSVELLINSLKPYINVHIIGRNTKGNNTGSITLYNSQDYNFEFKNENHSISISPIVLQFLNKNNETYSDGFIPNVVLCPHENVLNLGVLGENSDPIFNMLLNYIATGNNIQSNVCNINNYEFLFSSITSQREIDKGIFIKQVLPNTN